MRELNWQAAAVAAAGTSLTFAAPAHRPDLLILGLVTLAGALLWSPHAGPVLIGLALPTYFFSRQIAGPISATPPVVILALTWLAVLVRRRRVRLRPPASPYDPFVALFLLATLASLLVSAYPLLSVRELRALVLEPILFFLLLRAMPGSARLALAGFLVGATLMAGVASAQIIFTLGGTAAEGVRRAQAWYPSANHLALLLGRALPFLLAGALSVASRLWLPVAIVALGLLLTFSTGGWAGGLLAALVVIGVLRGWRMARVLGGVSGLAFIVVSGLAIAGSLPERLNPLRQTGGFRIDLWLSSLEMLRDHLLLGVGLDNFVYLYQHDYLREGAAAEANLSHPHNWLLHVWLELGLAGAIAFCGLLVGFVRTARRTLGQHCTRWLVAGALGAIVDMLVHGTIDNSYFLVDLAFLFWLCLALVLDAADQGTPDRGRRVSQG